MITYIKSINRKVWKVVETKIEIEDPENPTAVEEVLLQNNDIALSAIHDAIHVRTLSKSRTLRWLMRIGRSWRSHLRALKMKEDESVPEMFHRLQVLVNDLKAHGEMVEDKDFFRKFLICLPSRFGTLVTILVRSGLDTMTPNQVLGDIMTDVHIEMKMRRKKRWRRKMRRRMRKRRVWHSNPHPPRARQSKNHQVKLKI